MSVDHRTTVLLNRLNDQCQEIRNHLEWAWTRIIEVYREGNWVLKGYSTWAEFVVGEFPIRPQIARADRSEVFDQLAEAGLSSREIAAATGLSHETVSKESRSTSVKNLTPDPDPDPQPVVKSKPIIDPAPPRPPVAKAPRDMFDTIGAAIDGLKDTERDYVQMGCPRMSQTMLNAVMVGLEEIEKRAAKVRFLVMRTEEPMTDEALQHLIEESS